MTIELLKNPQKITIPNTTEFELDFNELIPFDGTAYIDWVSGTSFQVCGNGSIDSSSPAVTSANPKIFFFVKKNINIRIQGAAGGEVFNIYFTPQE